PLGETARRATDFVAKLVLGGGDTSRLEAEVKAVVAYPESFLKDALRGEFATALLNAPPPPDRTSSAPAQFGEFRADRQSQSARVMLSGIVTLISLSHSSNVESPILVTLLPIVTLVRLVQRSNAESPRLATLLGI